MLSKRQHPNRDQIELLEGRADAADRAENDIAAEQHLLQAEVAKGHPVESATKARS
jgi:hypothetical protein